MRTRLPASSRLAHAAPYVVLLGAGAYLFVIAGDFARFGRAGELSPGFWPRAVLIVLMIVCAGAIVSRLSGRGLESVRTRGARDAAAPEGEDVAAAAAREPEEAHDAHVPAHPYLLGGGIVLSIAYVAALDVLGFFVATALYLGLFMLLGRYRRSGIIVATSVLGSLAFVVVFMKIVYVSLPLGQGPFRALSAAILAALGVR
jgi:putative tricarboxylic transport membrane protein